jgi:hypothetical protein
LPWILGLTKGTKEKRKKKTYGEGGQRVEEKKDLGCQRVKN